VSILRVILAGLGIVMITGAMVAIAKGAPFPVLIAPGIIGLMFVFGALYERVHYKTPLARAPGRGFIATPERFVDPSSGRLVEVHVKPETGERAYVDIGAAPPHEGR
jgi:hypothetical protein